MNVRSLAWNARKEVQQLATRWLPSAVTWSAVASVNDVLGAWPAHTILAHPEVYRPTAEDEPLFLRAYRKPIYAGRDLVLPPLHVNVIPNGIIFPHAGLMSTSDGALLVESSKDLSQHLIAPERSWLRLRRPRKFQDSRAVTSILLNRQSTNWYHFFIDCLPRLFALSTLNMEIALLMGPNLPKHYFELLELVRPGNVSVVMVDDPTPVACERLLLSPCVTLSGCGLIRAEAAQWLRGRLEPHLPEPGKDRVYSSRARSRKYRNLVNEEDVWELFRARGFTRVDPGELSLLEQLSVFARASHVVGPHGANLTNVIACTAPTVLEIHPLNLCYWGLAKVRGGRFGAVFGERYSNADVRVDPMAVARAWDEL